MLCVFSSISSPERMDLQNEVFGNQIIVLPLRPAGAIYVKDNFHHTSGNISVQGSSADGNGGAVLEGSSLELQPPRYAFGVWKDTGGVSICHSEFLIFLHLVSLLIFGNQVDLPSNRRCDLRLE